MQVSESSDLVLPLGFRFAGVSCSIKVKPGTRDITLIVTDRLATAAGVYTQNQVVAAPVVLCRQRTPLASARGVVVNSGNANACTGTQGAEDAATMCRLAAEAISTANDVVSAEQFLVMSTGVIGRLMPMEKVRSGIAAAAAELAHTPQAFLNASDGILTTDHGRKITTRQCQIGGRTIRIAGMAKGAGMIGPNMATMLCCVLTDAAIAASDAQQLLLEAANRSFNNISVEGHTSTNDTMLLIASGAASGNSGAASGNSGAASENSGATTNVLTAEELPLFAEHLQAMCIELAKQIPTDGEGATHLIEIRVTGAASDADARRISTSVASSNLVKTAVYGSDPNWGRIVSAAGYAGVPLDMHEISLQVNKIPLFERGEPLPFDAKTVSASMRENHTTLIELSVGKGSGECTHWTSDLTPEYVRFNSDYTT